MLLTRLHVTLVLTTLVHCCTSSFQTPSFGGGSESGLSLSDVTQRKSGSEYVALDKGRISKAGSQGFDKDESGSRGQQEDSGRYSNQENNQKGFDVGRKSSGDAQSYNRGENNYEQHGSGQHKKGYHKSGFTNNYHKDESADKASFYEDSEDERGHRGFENKGGYHGQRAEDAFRDGRYDGGFTGRNKDHQGHYDNRDGYDNRRGHAGSYDDNRYYDDRRNYLHDGLDKAYDRNGNEMYYRREQPYRSHAHYSPAPLVSGPLYSKDYLDAPPPRYYPSRRDYHRGDYVYPEKGISYDDSYVDRGSYRGGVGHRGGGGGGGGGFEHAGANYGNSYGGSYGGARYKKGYQPSDYQDGFRRSY